MTTTTAPAMREYPKIYGPYNRHTSGPNRNKLIIGDWSRPEFEYLAGCEWLFTEKVDGTNVRVHWDGHRTTYGGRTANAQLQAKLVNWLDEHLPEELFEQSFGEDTATLYGEGHGAGIQKGGGNYSPTQKFVLFDVRVGNWWLQRDAVCDVAAKLGIGVVPLRLSGTLADAMAAVANGMTSDWGPFAAEGVVGHPSAGLLDRAGNRLMVKVKAVDFAGLNTVTSP